ncbi:ABC transporter permease [Tersicoccus sp. MR15.9]|uniref:ABC transporter permease n=1 Tax=Tersicoccus mangrovi TaxID=3121635 RepID=UPI002FE57D3C
MAGWSAEALASGPWVATLVAVALLTALAAVLLRIGRVPAPAEIPLAIGRAVVQLAALSLVLSGVITDGRLVALALAIMLGVAVATAARRLHAPRSAVPVLTAAIVSGPVIAMAVVFVTGAITFSPRYVLAVGGIVIGNAMTIATLTSRLFTASVIDHWDEVEAWLSLGATGRQAVARLARDAVHTALVPSIDQTRTTGIVVLPGAFVGAVFGGASPLEAGRFQLVVLASILAAGAVTGSLIAFRGHLASTRPIDHRA